MGPYTAREQLVHAVRRQTLDAHRGTALTTGRMVSLALQPSALALAALALATHYFAVESTTTFTIVNMCPYKVWPACVGKPPYRWAGWALETGRSMIAIRDAGWSGRYWGRTGCHYNQGWIHHQWISNGSCKTGDCHEFNCHKEGDPPATLAQITLAGPDGGEDVYGVNLMEGFNIPLSMRPVGGSGSCREASCKYDINSVCPPELKDKDGEACKSACLAFGDPKYCCTGEFSDPKICKPTNYSEIFHNHCPDASRFALDDRVMTCARADYVITFCPSPSAASDEGSPTQHSSLRSITLLCGIMISFQGF